MFLSSCLHRASTASKHFIIIPTDAHNYKITGMLKTFKIPILAPTCFGSRRNHHQGATSCLAETTIMILLCSSLMTWSKSWRHTSLCASVRYRNNVALTSNHCCNANASLCYICIVEVHVTVNDVTILCAAKKCFYGKITSQATIKGD